MAYFSAPRPRIFGHRGAAGLAPENTLPSFAVARALGVPYLELDVHGTADGEIVVLHDALLDRTTDGSGPVRERTWAEVAALDAGFHFTTDGVTFPWRGQGVRVPRLAEVVAAHPDACFNIEIKQGEPAIVETTLAVLRAGNALGRTLLAAEHHDIMLAIRAAGGDSVATGMSTADVLGFMDHLLRDDWAGYTPPGRALQVPAAHEGIEIVTAASVAAAHRAGLEVHVWTVNDATEMARLLDLGVDGLISDLPGLALEVVRSRVSRA